MDTAALAPIPVYLAGLRHLSARRIADAIPMFRAALADDPAHSGARRNLIRAYSLAGDHAAVIAETLQAPPACAESHYHRGTAFNALGQSQAARAALSVAVALDPSLAHAWLNLGNAHTDLDDLPLAESHCRRALALDPTLIEAHVSLGFVLTAQGKVAEGIGALEEAIRRAPGNARAHWNLAVAALLAGDLPRGFALYEWRKRHDRFRRDFIDLPGPVWDGGDPNGREILVHAEQGLGDTVQFARYLPEIVRRGGRPLLACEPALVPFLSSIEGARIVPKSAPLPRHDVWIDQMSLPRVFGTTLTTIPAPDGYLTADKALTEAHRATLPPGLRIGIAWAGNKLHGNDRRRTPPPEVFGPLLSIPGVHFVNLVPDRHLPGAAMPARALTDFAETAALISALDLTISVDTCVAHVAGALGRPAWVMLAHAPDWRWLLDRTDSPWYRSLRLFRQPAPGDWAAVVVAIRSRLPNRREPG